MQRKLVGALSAAAIIFALGALAQSQFGTAAEAKAMRRQNAAIIFTAGLVIAAFVAVPIVNLATPLFGMAFMVHMHKRLSGPRPELIEPRRKTGMPVA